jgi:membrane protein DedA with SNARE-associated domain
MLYAGALASGAFSGSHVVLFGSEVHNHAAAFIVVVLAGLLGNLVGALGGWSIGWYAEAGLERRRNLFHLTPERLARAHRWFDRFGAIAVPVGFVTPGVRSFVALPAGIARMPLVRFLLLALVGCAVFCVGMAGIGWVVGSNYDHFRKYLDIAVAVGVVALLASFLVRRRRRTRLASRASDPAR